MLRRYFAILLFSCAAFAVLAVFALRLSGAGGLFSSIIDPDLPEEDVVSGLIDKQDYLRRRADYYLSLRGFEAGETFDPNARPSAIQQMEADQLDLFTNLKAAAASAGPDSPEMLQLAISSTAWTELGPAPIPNGQTEVRVTPVSGRTTAIAVHPTNPNIAFVGTAQGGLYRTFDGGETWTPLFDDAQTLAIGAVAFAPSDPSIVYVGTGEANLSADSFFGVGLYRINDALEASPVLTGPINPPVATAIAGTTAFSGVSISKVVVHPTDPATVFVSTASGSSGNPGGGSLNTTVPPVALLGLYRSTNATAALAEIEFQKLTVTRAGSVAPDTSGNRSIIDVVIEPGVPNNLICTVLSNIADGGVYVTSNALAGSPTFTRTLPLGSAMGVSANEGRAELAINKTVTPTDPVVTVYVASGESAGPAAGAAACGTGGTLRSSTDGGMTWSPPLAAASGFCAGQCFYDIALAVDPVNPLTVLLGGNVTGACTKLIARSDDGGDTFNPAPSAGVHADNQVLVFAPSNSSVAYMGTDGGIYRSDDGGNTWDPRNNTTFRATQFQSIATHPTDREIMLGGTQDNGTIKRNADGTFTRTNSGDGGYTLFDRNGTDPNNAIAYQTTQASTGSIAFGRSTNAGSSFSRRNCPGNGIDCNDSVLFYPPIALGPGNPNTFYYGTDRLYRSADGLTLTPVSQRPLAVDAVPPATPVNQVLTTIAISPLNDNARLVGLRNGKVFATSNGSSTLADVTTDALPKPNQGTIRRAVSRAIFSPTDQKTAYITFGGYNVPDGHHIFKTTNLDTSDGAPAVEWTPSGFGIPDVPVNSITIDRLAPDNMYAATDIGVYRSSDAGATWTPFSNGLPRIAVFDIAFQEQMGKNAPERVLRIATHGRGIWEIAVPSNAEPSPALLVNIGSRLRVEGGDNVLIGGFIVRGSNPKRVLVRAIGPSLKSSGQPVPGHLADPTLELFNRDGSPIAFNDNWQESEARDEIANSGFAPEDERDAVIAVTLDPETYTAIMRGKDGSTGVGLVEVYDRSEDGSSELANISSRGFIATDDNVLIGGFIVATQNAGTRVLLRAIGPSLRPRLSDALGDPELEVFDRNGIAIGFNDNWKNSERRADIEKTGIPPSEDAESAVLLDVVPAPYTAIMRGKDRTTGVGLIEIYNVK
ncbi:MAG TPA: hypothetical protein VK993_12040 [Chthoniobacterales bacterium]|nr:hypothetical protein [Chthoniobacterales bacterium]